MDEPKEGELFVAEIAFGGSRVRDIECRIFFSEAAEEKPKIYLYLSPTNATCLDKAYELSFSAYRAGIDANHRRKVVAPHAFPASIKTSGHGTPHSETIVILDFDEIRIFETWGSQSDREESDSISFLVSKNDLLWPSMLPELLADGSVKMLRHGGVNISLAKNISISFEPRFLLKQTGKGEFIQRAHLVASAQLPPPKDQTAAEINELLSQVDDFLLVASLIEKRRITCFGWQIFSGPNSERFYRGNYCRDSSESERSIRGLILRPHSNQFLQTCFRNFQKLSNKEAIRHAIYSAVPLTTPVLETGFLQLFSGIEALVLSFRRERDLEFVVDIDKWSVVKKRIEKSIKQSTSDLLTSEQRCAMYKKLPELNRIPLRAGFEAFCSELAIDLSDLWPLFGQNGTVGLVDIRNKLIHGDPLPRRLFSCLVLAETHLDVILNRMLIRFLGCDPEITSVSKKNVEKFEFKIDFHTAKSMLSEYLAVTHTTD